MRGDEFFVRMAGKPPFSRLHPKMSAFFKDYLSHEKIIPFGDRFVLNTHFPPYPSRAFERFTEQFDAIGEAGESRRLFSVTWAVSNRCGYRCWHCYNAGRSQQDVPLARMVELARELQELGAVMVTLTGGEPLLRKDLEKIAAAFDDRTCLILGTTGDALSAERARSLRESGFFAVGVSLDSADEAEHDRLRGRRGAFKSALAALRNAAQAGLYPYVVSLATREFLERKRFMSFLRFAADRGALEAHLLEPSATGRLAGREDVILEVAERRLILDYQNEVMGREDLPILSCFAYLESEQAFGCGAGLTHLYIDGSGEVCPCNLVPISFGSAAREPLAAALDRMGRHFRQPRTACVGCTLAGRIPAGRIPTPIEVSHALCEQYLPESHELPRFFKVRADAAQSRVGAEELRAAYDRVHGDYDEFWLKEAAGPVDELIGRLGLRSVKNVFEAGCGTGYATARLAARLGPEGRLLAADISEGMISQARRRVNESASVSFLCGDALKALRTRSRLDLVFSSWVLGYIPLKPFFAAAAGALDPGGRLAFVVHRDNSPREPLEIFAELVAEDPCALTKQVAFDFPRDARHLRQEIEAAGLEVEDLREGQITFRYDSPEQVLEHLLKSGAGTAFHDALDPARRPALERLFLRRLAERQRGPGFEVIHDFLACVAGKR
ncbi:MAG: radical SAM protein [Elusimicrobia bacterium]|nr:radical SAM protein [Elusimicrobiota bacterium]